MNELPFKVEYSKSGVAGCRFCHKSINKDVLRMAVMEQVRIHYNQIFYVVLTFIHF